MPRYSKDVLYQLLNAPRSRLVPGHLEENFAEIFVGGTAGEDEVLLRERGAAKSPSVKPKAFQPSTVSFAHFAGVKEPEAAEKKKEVRPAPPAKQDHKGDKEPAERNSNFDDFGSGKGGKDDRNGKHERFEDSDPSFKEWERAKFAAKWNDPAGGDLVGKHHPGGKQPAQQKAQREKKAAPPAQEPAPQNSVDAMFASSDQTAASLGDANPRPAGGSRFMKHFQQSHSPSHAGGTEEEVLRQVAQNQSSHPHYPTTLDVATFERQLIASHSLPSNHVQQMPFKNTPATNPGLVDAASLERSLLSHLQPQGAQAAPAPAKPVVSSQAGTFDAASLEQQLLASPEQSRPTAASPASNIKDQQL
eukprot:gene6085-9347_t